MSELLLCRSCGHRPLRPVIDLGLQPLANNLLRPEDIGKPEPKFPLEVAVCEACWLMQITHIIPPVDLFSDYRYFSSFSDEMLRHARDASSRHIAEKELGAGSFVVEIASNDGYLLKNFVQAGIPCLGFEPAANVAEVAQKVGVESRVEFFGRASAGSLAAERGQADLILGNNVFAHAPDTNDFVAGLSALLKPDGWIVLEFPYGVDMIAKTEFDTIYHEHVFYFTLTPLTLLFARHGLEAFHVERLGIHGGSLRVYAAHQGAFVTRPSVTDLLAEETTAGVSSMAYYEGFRDRAARIKNDLTAFVAKEKALGKRVAGYGASAKGSTLLNYCGFTEGDLEFVADRSTHKQGRLTPGTHFPIVPPEELVRLLPDYALLLTWNFANEILAQQSAYREAGGKFVIPLPTLNVV